MSFPFQDTYSSLYDTLYADKDYGAEVDLVEHLFQRYGDRQPERILDLGCGTGGHAIPLARRGYRVTGVDRSAAMLARAEARRQAEPLDPSPVFLQGDVRTVDLGETFDAVLCMFAVLSYQTENADVAAALARARAHLRPGGLYLFDVWFGPAVLHERPSQRVKTIEREDSTVIRMVSPRLDVLRHTNDVNYDLMVIRGDRVVERTHETHVMRYFFPQELAYFLDRAGFDLLRLGVFPEIDRDPDETTWNVMAVARARGEG